MFRSLLVCALVCMSAASAAQDTLHLRVHDRATVVTDPSRGVRSHLRSVQFPAPDVAVRKILLTVSFACPDSMRCADWDYLDHILVHPRNSTDTFELARVLTPYGGQFPKDWRWRWVLDVTDFSPALRGEVEVDYLHSGYEPANDRGWSVTLDFDLVLGPPAAEVLSVKELYRGHFNYGDSARSVEADLPPRAFLADERAAFARVRVQQTGHGMHEDDGCGEFCAKWRAVKFDGKEVDRRKLWKDCGNNPLQPQAGTWIYDRAAWCPGELQPPDVFTVPLALGAGEPAAKHTVDIDMQPYVHDSTTARTDIAAYLVQLGQPRARNDASVEAILIPTDDPVQGMHNPAVHEPRVVIRNQGSDPLDMISITYGTDGFKQRMFAWNGRLRFGMSDTVVLPHVIDSKPGTNTFRVRLGDPNSRNDKWKADNELTTAFTAAPVLDSVLILQLRTNKAPEHNSLQLASTRGRVHVQRPLGSLRADTLYTDTLHLPPGAYELQLADTAGDGLEFWYNTEQGRGNLRLLDQQGRLLVRFNSDNGHGVKYAFMVGGIPNVPLDTLPDIGLFPVMTDSLTTLDYFANDPGALEVLLVNEAGEELRRMAVPGRNTQAVVPITVSGLPPGRCWVKVLRDGREVYSRRMRIAEGGK